jgi:LmbE family N-acetylglucosaminyl deacetylase
MAVVFLLAHFDDEYCAVPLILRALAEGADCRFVYVADYRAPEWRRWRRGETEAFLCRLGFEASHVLHSGYDSGVYDRAVISGLQPALAAVRDALDGVTVERFVTPAWEGGHPDHDACALMAVILAEERGDVPIDQFGLYNGRRFPKPFYRACSPIPENGPETRLELTPRAWWVWLTAVGYFPSQTWNWLGLWPGMFMTFARRRGFAYQRLEPGRVRARPHAGRLHYEWMFRTPYSKVRALADAALEAHDARGATTSARPQNIST